MPSISSDFEIKNDIINVIITIAMNPNNDDTPIPIIFLVVFGISFFLRDNLLCIEKPLTFTKEYEGFKLFMIIIQHLYLF